MDPITIGLLAGAGLGLAKGLTVDKDKEKQDRKYAAAVARYSPWTGMAIPEVHKADPLGNAMQGGLTGAMFGQGMNTANAQNDLMASQQAWYDQQANGGAATLTDGQPIPARVVQSPGAVGYQPGAGQGMIAAVPNNAGYSPWYLQK